MYKSLAGTWSERCSKFPGDFILFCLSHSAHRMPVVAKLWQELLLWPNNFILALLSSPTPRHFHSLRVSPEMERKLVFLTQQVQFGKQGMYETWFQRHHLATPESQGLRPDLVRYVLGAIHPSNEMLRSGTTPRWAVVGSFLTSCTGQVISAFTKLALFYDWISFNPEKDNVMSLEPAALLMQNSVRTHPQVDIIRGKSVKHPLYSCRYFQQCWTFYCALTRSSFLMQHLLCLRPLMLLGGFCLPSKSDLLFCNNSKISLLSMCRKVLPGLGLFHGRNLTPGLRSRAVEAFEVSGFLFE